MEDRRLMLNASIVTRKVIMHEIFLRKEIYHATTTITKEENIIKERTMTEDMREEEGTPQETVKNIILLTRNKGHRGMKVTLQINMNTFSFLL